MAAENDLPDSEDVKKKALVRLTVAGLVTAAALGGLWLLDHDKPAPATQPGAQPAPAPIRAAEPLAVAPPPSLEQDETTAPPQEGDTLPETQAPQGSEDTSTPPSTSASTPASAPHSQPLTPPPPPRVTNIPSTPPRPTTPSGTVSSMTPGATPAPSTRPATAPALPPAAAPSPGLPPTPPRLPPPGSGNLVVQMGVFSEPARAEELVQRLRKQGISARMETRVYVGPFLNRQEADKARQEMKRQGLDGLITTVAPMK
jgi:cell division protein FtsN